MLGTDGFGRSDSREQLRHFFEVDAKFIVLAALSELKALELITAKQITDFTQKPTGLTRQGRSFTLA